jgi:peptide/nickel transport system substrate-binding protein
MKKLLAIMIAAILTLGTLAGCGSKGDAGDKKAEHLESLTIATNEWEGLDIYQLSTVYPSQTLVASPLFIMGDDGTFTPNVAEKYTVSEDGKQITITLPSDLKFPDGTSVTPEDLKRSLEWGMEISPYNGDYGVLQSVEVSGNDVILNLSGYSETLMFYLGSEYMPIMKASQIDSLSEEDLLWKAETYGPYYVDEYVAGDHVTLKPNPYYKCLNENVKNQGACTVGTITVRFFSDQFALIQAVNAGEINYAEVFPSEGVSELNNENMEVKNAPQPAVTRLLMNNNNAILSNEKIREAIMYGINREEIAENSDGGSSAAYAYSVSGMLDYPKDAEDYFKNTYCNNVDKAKSLLEEAGWKDTDNDGFVDKDGKKLELKIISRSTGSTIEMLQIQMKNIGIQLDIEQVDSATYKTAIAKEDSYEMALASYSWGVTSSTLAYIVNDANILPSDEYFNLCYTADATPDDTKRVETLDNAERILMDTKCNVPVIRKNSIFVYDKNISGMVVNNNGRIFVNDVK